VRVQENLRRTVLSALIKAFSIFHHCKVSGTFSSRRTLDMYVSPPLRFRSVLDIGSIRGELVLTSRPASLVNLASQPHQRINLFPSFAEMMQVRCSNCQHLTCALSRLNVPSLNELRRHSRNQQLISPTWTKRGFLALEGRVYVPNYNDARLKILRARHDSPLAGHPGISKTIELISQDYTWVGLKKDVEAYVSGCAHLPTDETKSSKA